MVVFQDIQDVEEWLAPLDYIAFWEAIAPYRLGMDDREHCDELIASGKIERDTLLCTRKFLARMELRIKFNLRHRIPDHPHMQYLWSIH